MATPDELRANLAKARAEFRAALEAVADVWETKPPSGEGEAAWSPREAAEHAIPAETLFTYSACKAAGYPGPARPETSYPTAADAIKTFDEVVVATNEKLAQIQEKDLALPQETFGSVGELLQINIDHMHEHAAQMKAVLAHA